MSTPLSMQPVRAPWQRLLRSGAIVLLLCVAIATLLSASDMGRFWHVLAYSSCIGVCCWLIIQGGLHALAHGLNRLHTARGHPVPYPRGFPGWRWMPLPVIAGVVFGPLLGNALAGWLGLEHAASLWPMGNVDSRTTWVLTLLSAAVAVTVLSLMGSLSHSRAEAEGARRAATEHQLKLLESQLEPHMLFNTLANLRVLIGTDPQRATAMLDRLIGLLRATLNASRRGRHALADEFAHLDDYLALMQVRMGSRLQVDLQLPDALRALPLPPLLLQPLVENSIKHGLEPQIGGGRIEVAARRDADTLVLTVRDSGVGLDPAAATRADGFGLQQVRERLRTVYSGRAALSLRSDAQGGTLAELRLPIES